MVSNEYEQLSSEALEAARICANKYDTTPQKPIRFLPKESQKPQKPKMGWVC